MIEILGLARLGRILQCWLALAIIGSRIFLATSTASEPSATPVNFQHDVMAVLSKAGCNAGACHGNLNGKGGFFLSLRGQDAQFDFQQLVRANAGRRINPVVPEDSLTLVKATGRVPHQGGKRIATGSPEYNLLVDWIRSGLTPPDPNAPRVTRLDVSPAAAILWMPTTEVQLSVTATFSDGSTRDVTRLAVYEPSDPMVHVSVDGLVKFAEPRGTSVLVRFLDGQCSVEVACRECSTTFQWTDPEPENWIDEFVFERLEKLKINPAPLAGDSVFLRRVSLDLLGVLPTAEEARQFVDDSSPTKRQALVDRYLSRPEFASMWALKWSDLVRSEEKTLDATGVEKLHAWMQTQFAADVPLDEFARQLIASRGSTYDNPPANYWRAHREPLVRAETTAQVFLGVRLQCAKCHNHPFDRWSQDEYYQWSSLFAGIDYEIVANERKDDLDKHEFVGEQNVLVKAEGTVKNARTGQPANPTFLGSDEPVDGDRLEQLAAWMTRPDNRMFAEAQANRIWYHLMGVGLVEPVDDLRLTNPPSHPELLKRLADEFIASGYSLKHLVRLIVSSRTYQLSPLLDQSQLGPAEQIDPRLMARAVVRRLSAEQILDAQSQVLDVPASFEGYPLGTRAVEIAGVERVRRKRTSDDEFLRKFGKPERLLACECERTNEATLGQALTLVGDKSLHQRLQQSDNRIGRLLAEEADPADIVDSLYWTALSRAPTVEEMSELLSALRLAENSKETLEDIVWVLLNSKELLFRN